LIGKSLPFFSRTPRQRDACVDRRGENLRCDSRMKISASGVYDWQTFARTDLVERFQKMPSPLTA
jgi:hypothetical protein